MQADEKSELATEMGRLLEAVRRFAATIGSAHDLSSECLDAVEIVSRAVTDGVLRQSDALVWTQQQRETIEWLESFDPPPADERRIDPAVELLSEARYGMPFAELKPVNQRALWLELSTPLQLGGFSSRLARIARRSWLAEETDDYDSDVEATVGLSFGSNVAVFEPMLPATA